MTEIAVRAAALTTDTLGEGPVYDTRDACVRWVDIVQARWHRLALRTGAVTTVALDEPLTGFAPAVAGGYIGAFAGGLARLGADGSRRDWLHRPEAHLPDNRFNDAGTDPSGRFLAGTMNTAGTAKNGALYLLAPDGALTVLRRGIGIANTIAFSPDGTTLYTADSSTGDLMAFAYDTASGRLGERRTAFRPDPALPGVPDGSAVDRDGYLWNCRWDGGCVVRLAPDGRTDRIVALPVTRPTSCVFVGATLYVTTARYDLDEAALAAQPLAGALLCFDAGIEGVDRPPFGLAQADHA